MSVEAGDPLDLATEMTNAMITIRVNIAEVKARLSSYLERVEGRETIVLCRRNVRIAELRPLRKARDKPRRVGIDRGMTVPPGFFEPFLPDAILDAFEGRDESR